MLLPAVNATGNIQLSSPWAFYEYFQSENQQDISLPGLLLTGVCLFPSNTVQFSYRPENIIRGPLSITAFSGPGNIAAFTDDLLDWDTGVEAAPPRPSGKISVTLRYAGRGGPKPLGDY